jgi:hypothetical protein
MYGEMIIFALTWEKIPLPSRQDNNGNAASTKNLLPIMMDSL